MLSTCGEEMIRTNHLDGDGPVVTTAYGHKYRVETNHQLKKPFVVKRGPAGGSKQGGAGLHRSRGGARATAADPSSAEGKGGRGKGKQSDKGGRRRSGGPRSRHLDEDETTGSPPREIPPPVIE
ncbi:hypothetical protein AOB60_36065 [Streptomyces noursei]|uniref:Uncharacterized protein n=1 Tax=Streptomyces noursei TaxID=1971 RepID=A0A2N8PE53_STRNR|nr:hypothetical protein AOB60_36065 [Streptomyces noursei]